MAETEAGEEQITEKYYREKYNSWMKTLNKYLSLMKPSR
jgi:hypothetical protein